MKKKHDPTWTHVAALKTMLVLLPMHATRLNHVEAERQRITRALMVLASYVEKSKPLTARGREAAFTRSISSALAAFEKASGLDACTANICFAHMTMLASALAVETQLGKLGQKLERQIIKRGAQLQ